MVRILAFLFFTVLTTPAWAAVPNTVGWTTLPNTQINSVCQYPGQGNTGCGAITGAWGDALFDSTRNQMVLLANGGHNDYPGNEVIAAKIGATSAVTDTQTIERIKNGSASPTSLGGTCQTSDGFPRSMHTYTNVEYIPDFDRYLSFGGARWQDGNDVDCVFWLQMPAMTWVFGGTTIISGRQGAGVYGSGSAWDQERHVVWAFDQFNVYKYTPTSGGGTWSTPTQTSFSGQGVQWDMKGLVDPVRDRYYVIGDGAIWYWNVSNPNNIGARIVPSTSGCGTAFNGGPGSQYYPVQDRIVIWNGGNTITLLNPANHTCTTVSHAGGPAATAEGTLGRFKYSAKDNLFITCQVTSANCATLRLDVQNAETDWARRKNAPGVTQSEGFDTIGDYTNGVKYFVGDGGFDGADMDTSIKTSGTGALKFTLPAGRATSNISGDFRVCLRAPCAINGNDTTAPGFGFPSDFWLSWRIRISPTMVTNLANFWRAGGQHTGWKSVNMHNGAQGSCGALEITKTIDTSFNNNTQIWYKECSPGITTDGNSNGNGGSPYFQQGNNTFSTTTNGFWCNWNNSSVAGTGTGVGCFNWQWQNEWITFIEHYQIGANGAATSQLDAWIYREGSTTALQIQNVNGESFGFGSNPVGQRTYNQVSFVPYMTGLSTSAPVDAFMWFDEFLASTEPISAPGQFAAPPVGDTTPPSAPTNLRVVSIAQKLVNLAWDASTDDTAVTGYLFEHCNGVSCSSFVQVGSAVPGLSIADSGLLVSTPYTFRVRATDAANNLSSYSSTVGATTPNVAYHPTLNLRRVSNEEDGSLLNTTMKGAP